MAQVLKEEVKEKIVKAAKEEFMENGYDNSSMRSIASKAGVTVGNLYRYFKNKEEISSLIINPAINKINDSIKQLTGNNFSFNSTDFHTDLTTDQMRQILDILADQLVESYHKNRIEFRILLLTNGVANSIKSWLEALIYYFITHNYQLDQYENSIKALSKAYASSIIAGFKEFFNEKDLSINSQKNVIKIYFRSYIAMLDNDIRKYIGELS